jgi:hypothetical protein
MRLRTTAPPSAFLMLNPNRLCGNWFARKKTVKWEFERRLPVRYTASNSPRRTNRAARGNFRSSGSLGCKPMASLLTSRRQHLAASNGLHAYAKSVRLGPPPFSRLICSLWQNNPPLVPIPDYVITFRAHPMFRSTVSVNCFGQRANDPRLRVEAGLSTRQPIRSTHQPTGRPSSRFRISKCSRPQRTRSRKRRGRLIRPGKLLHPWKHCQSYRAPSKGGTQPFSKGRMRQLIGLAFARPVSSARVEFPAMQAGFGRIRVRERRSFSCGQFGC